MDTEKDAQKRAEIILAVQSGQMTASEGAEALGISRKNFHRWQKRGLEALIDAMEKRPNHPPKAPEDPEKRMLEQQCQTLRREVAMLELKLKVKEIWVDEAPPEPAPVKKKRKRKKPKKRSKR